MKKIKIGALSALSIIIFASCGKKMHPSTRTQNPNVVIIYDSTGKAIKDSAVVTEKTIEKKPVMVSTKPATYPKVISVNDQAAKKSTDGRLYYDVQGHRYWKNYKDGKYYLYDKSMYNNPAFKPPSGN